ncbi:hypothetical protein [Sporolactobacillus spathodeae]|uniref:Competence protein ComGC n=1 Tax=Sporolactobacillus spathodeae TaxID=1465502 RepID=A0ABS2Q6Z1_9BACL|nr:hypothetical protein [Sporolactobacillus spathodeae]MBM7657562.1 competence protein ComGC [Sporolactobacillus spathodeae]
MVIISPQKKYLKVLVSIFIIAILLIPFFPSSAFAGSSVQQNINQTNSDSNEIINTLDKYVNADDGKFDIEHIPTNVINELGREEVNKMIEGIRNVNQLAKNGEVTITDNGTVYESNDDDIAIQGGNVNKVVWHWWGLERYASVSQANRIARNLNRAAILGGTASGLITLFGFWPVGVVGGLSSGYWAWAANDISYVNSLSNRGIKISFTWALVYHVKKQ